MSIYDEVEKKTALVDLLAIADGCEGGEFLRALHDLTLHAAGGGYAYSALAEDSLPKLLDAEIAAHKQIIYGPHAEQYGYENVEELRKAIEEAENVAL